LRLVAADPIGDIRLGEVVCRLGFLRPGSTVLPQPGEIGAEGFVHGDDAASCGTLRWFLLGAQCVMHVGHDHLVKHHAVTGENSLDGITWPECHDCADGGSRAVVPALLGLAWAFTDALGNLASD
jgi:hypothetical protein